MKLLIVTGMSGAGKTRILNALEDIGFYCIDNLPPGLLNSFISFRDEMGPVAENVAITIDSRSQNLFESMDEVLDLLKIEKVDHGLLFIDCEDTTLLRRYKESRRSHPLMYFNEKLTISEAISLERTLLANLRQRSDYVLDSTHLQASELKAQILQLFSKRDQDNFRVNFVSFGFKYGLLNDGDLIFDLRCLPNPFYVEELRELTGESEEIVDYLWQYQETKDLYNVILNYLEVSIPLYLKEGKTQLVVGLGCTGGKHRSVAFAELLSKDCQYEKTVCGVNHRDINRG